MRAASFNHLVGAGEERGWDRETESPGRFEIDDQLEPSGVLLRPYAAGCSRRSEMRTPRSLSEITSSDTPSGPLIRYRGAPSAASRRLTISHSAAQMRPGNL